nr:guanine nucleotide-binding protein-like NSN1 [Paratrimastix eleionoma]
MPKKRTLEAKIQEQHRKQKKLDAISSSHAKKDPGVPDLRTVGNALSQQHEGHRKRIEQRKQQQNEKRKEQLQQRRTSGSASAPSEMNVEPTEMEKLMSLRNDAQQKQRDFVEQQESTFLEPNSSSSLDNTKQSNEKSSKTQAKNNRRQFFEELRKVILNSDVILEILDARDPIGSRSPQLESWINNQGRNKRIVLVLNKIDLVPREAVHGWLKYLSTEYPTIAFKSVTANASLGRSRFDDPPTSSSSSSATTTTTSTSVSSAVTPTTTTVPSATIATATTTMTTTTTTTIIDAAPAEIAHQECLGGDTLLHLLKSYARSHNMSTRITVGVVGYPNVGKSSVINSLKRCKAVQVSSVPGTTKSMQSVQLDNKVALLDCPGVIFTSQSGESDILRNCLRVEDIDDPVAPVGALLQKCSKAKLIELYNLTDSNFSTPEQFLTEIAHHFGKLRKGGLPNLDAAARIILHDWNGGKIPYYTQPPELPQPTQAEIKSATIVGTFAPEFDLNTLQESDLVCHLPEEASMGPMIALPSSSVTVGTVATTTSTPSLPSTSPSKFSSPSDLIEYLNQHTNDSDNEDNEGDDDDLDGGR